MPFAFGVVKFARFSRAAAGTSTIEVAPGTGLKHVVISFGLASDAATAQPQFESAATVIAGPFATTSYCGEAGTREAPLFECSPNEALELVTLGVGNCSGFVAYMTTAA